MGAVGFYDFIASMNKFGNDFHVHSSCSDGLKSREQIFNIANSAGLKSLVFTEHSNIVYYEQTKITARKEGLETNLPGIEVSCFDSKSGLNVHLLAFGGKLMSDDFLNWATDGVLRREKFYRQVVVEVEESLGITLPPFIDLLAAKPISGVVLPYPYETRRYLISSRVIANYVAVLSDMSVNEVLEKYVPPYLQTDIPELGVAIRRIKDEGGVVILAHPLWFSGDVSERLSIIERSIDFGVDGIEVRHPKHDCNATLVLYNFEKDKHLLVTGGSDYHGRSGEDKNLGCYGITEEEKSDILEFLIRR